MILVLIQKSFISLMCACSTCHMADHYPSSKVYTDIVPKWKLLLGFLPSEFSALGSPISSDCKALSLETPLFVSKTPQFVENYFQSHWPSRSGKCRKQLPS